MIGGTKEGELRRSIEMIEEILHNKVDRKEIMFMLYFLAGSQYDQEDLKIMADMIRDEVIK